MDAKKHLNCVLLTSLLLTIFTKVYPAENDFDNLPYKKYPAVNDVRPNLQSPFKSTTGDEYVIAVTKEQKYAIIPVTLSNNRKICKQLVIDEKDFPGLAKNGLHSDNELNNTKFITGRSLKEITTLARPGGLSSSGFLAEDEDILSVLKADNWIVQKLGLTHPALAKPLFFVLNLMDEDLALDRWNMAKHEWEHIQYFYYNERKVFVRAFDSKGGQKSIFDDGIKGAFRIKLWREFDKEELALLQKKYHHLSEEEFELMKSLLSIVNTGEMQPQYIQRYGFYEGHTFWRTDPIALSFIFGLKELGEIESLFPGKLNKTLTEHFVE